MTNMTNGEIYNLFISKHKDVDVEDYRPLWDKFIEGREGITIWEKDGGIILYFPPNKPTEEVNRKEKVMESNNLKETENTYIDTNNTIFLPVPDNTVKLTVTAKILGNDDEFFECTKVIDLKELIESRIEYEMWSDENARYVLVNKS